MDQMKEMTEAEAREEQAREVADRIRWAKACIARGDTESAKGWLDQAEEIAEGLE